MKGKERVRFLKSRPRRSLYRLQLKFPESTTYLLKRVRRIHFIAVVIEEPQRGDTPA